MSCESAPSIGASSCSDCESSELYMEEQQAQDLNDYYYNDDNYDKNNKNKSIMKASNMSPLQILLSYI